ncbi:hypothetical protein TELCIR_00773 [Teladorsagia circumcincta]|uniref:Gamma-soluble NSF attachment protein n=1 Tax=Teladorsagia circumcincta TaxID=45464 RepID=A0A2G9V3Q0_TELCI|nr:hypothetical protein TELCIR_00773 [Teladorsagia circumcincta]
MLKLKLKPDYDGAATALERASVCYRNAGDANKAAKALISAAGHYEQLGNLFHAAKAREGAAMLLRDAGDSAGAYPLFEKAIDQYAESGSLDTAAMSVEKAAKVVVLQEPEKAIKESGRVGQLAIALVLVQLAMGDSVAAAKYYQWTVEQCAEFEFTDDARACRQLIGGWESGDDEQFQNILKDGVLRSMDNEYLRLMKKLHAPEGTGETDKPDNGGDEDDLK